MDIASYSVAEIKRITDADEIKKILPVISSAWGMPDLSAALKDTINAMRFHGGLVLAAYSGSKIIGMQFSFPGYRRGKVYLYSHMTGVSEDNKYSGVGRMLKLYQKEWALDHSFDLIAWTFDPVRSLNAYFNLVNSGGELKINRAFTRDLEAAEKSKEIILKHPAKIILSGHGEPYRKVQPS